MTIDEAIEILINESNITEQYLYNDAMRMAIASLEMQKKLAEYKDKDICEGILFEHEFEYESVANVSDFLIEKGR